MPRRRGSVVEVAVLGGLAIVAVVAWMTLAFAGDPDTEDRASEPRSDGPASAAGLSSSADPDAIEVSDFDDPVTAGCVYVEPAPERLKTEVVESVGLVSLVYSPACDAYWARRLH